MSIRSLLMVLGLLFSVSCMATTSAVAVEITSLSSGSELDSVLQYAEDPSAAVPVAAVDTLEWHWGDKNSMSFGYTASVYWFRLNLQHSGTEAVTRLLSLSYPVLDHVHLHSRRHGGDWEVLELGDKQPFAERPVDHRFFVIPLTMNPGEQAELLFRVETSSSMQFPLSIWEERDFFVGDQKQILGMGLYYGIMIIMVLYNLFVFFSVREANYLYYVLYVGCMAGFLASLQGLNFQFLWPEATWWNDHSILVFLGGVVLFVLVFTRNFLQLKEIPLLNRLFNALALLAFGIILFSNLFPYSSMIRLLIGAAVLGISLAIISGIIRWGQGYSSARYYTIAWSVLLLGGVILAMNKFDLLPRNFFTENIVQVGSVVEVILLSFALADRLNNEKRKRYTAQFIALEHEKVARKSQESALQQERNARLAQEKALQHEREAREAQALALAIQKQATETLEQRVKERTLELENANRKLELMSITDPLTNLRNRRFFDQIMQREMARAIRTRESICVLMIDVDHFKKVNDVHGHQAGDEILQVVAQAVRQTVHRSTDLLARYGGEEFIMVLPGTSADGAEHVAECIRSTISRLNFDRISAGLRVSVSIGIHGAVPGYQESHENWVRYADEALYFAKANGRNQVVRYKDF